MCEGYTDTTGASTGGNGGGGNGDMWCDVILDESKCECVWFFYALLYLVNSEMPLPIPSTLSIVSTSCVRKQTMTSDLFSSRFLFSSEVAQRRQS